MPGTPGRSGGARPGSGRKRKTRAERIEPTLQKLEKRLQQDIDANVTTLEQLAAGGLQTISERWEPAGNIFIETVEPVLGPEGALTGKTVTRRMPMLPHKPADELVLVCRTIKTHAPNLAANAYLINRLVGTPCPIEEHEEHEESNTLPDDIDAIVKRIYGTTTT